MPPVKPTHLRCKDGFVLPDRTVVKAGQVVAATDRVVKLAPHCFEAMDDVVEAATAAPNERRLMPRRHAEDVVMTAAAKRNVRRTGRRTPEPEAEAPAEVTPDEPEAG